MENLDSYKNKTLMEGTLQRFFKKFEDNKTDGEIIEYYYAKGITVPEQFLTKARKQYESLKKQKLEIEFAEQEAKNVINTTIEVPQIQLFDLPGKKEMSSRLYKENKITK